MSTWAGVYQMHCDFRMRHLRDPWQCDRTPAVYNERPPLCGRWTELLPIQTKLPKLFPKSAIVHGAIGDLWAAYVRSSSPLPSGIVNLAHLQTACETIIILFGLKKIPGVTICIASEDAS